MMNQISKMMKDREHIRNVSIIAHVDHGKTSLTESLAHVHMDEKQEAEKGITIKSAAISLQFSRTEKRIKKEEKEEIEIEQPYLINLIDSPGHVDFSSEVTAALRITDGAICVIDCIEGVCVQTETVLRQAILERVKPVLFLNKVDRIWLEKKLSLMEAYKLFKNTIESTNVICHTYKDDVLGNINLNPKRANVAFGSGYFGWGFTIQQFAEMYSAQFGISPNKLVKKFWGNNYYDKVNCSWSKADRMDENKNNAFCEYILKPIKILHDSIMNEEKEIYMPIIEALRLNITTKEFNKCEKPKDILKLVMSKWLTAKRCVLDLCADSLPSPIEAQQYRIPSLYTGPLDSKEAQDMLLCDPKGKLSMYVSKMIPIKDSGRFIAFGRVFSGTMKNGQELRILGPNDTRDNDDEKTKAITKKSVQRIIMMKGNKPEQLNECPAGNICGVMGIDKYLIKSGTLCDSAETFPFKTMKFSVSPVVKVAVDVIDTKDLKKLKDGLQRLAKYDNIVQVKLNKEGQQIVAGSGELHLQTCLKTLQDDFMKNVKISITNPIVSFCEGINGICGTTETLPALMTQKQKLNWKYPNKMIAKSPNGLNRLYLTCQPLSDEVCQAIEDDKIKLRGDMKAFGREFNKQFPHWHKGEAAKIWSFGCAPYGKPNVLVDMTKGVDYLDKVKSSIIQGFIQCTDGGILCDEPLRGVRFNLVDAKIHPEPAHHGSGQIIPAMVRACKAGLLASTPCLYEPMYQVDIEIPTRCENGVHNTFGKVRGEFKCRTDKDDINIPLCTITGYVPIIETLKSDDKDGFTTLLRANTGGRGFAVMKFSHWQKVDGDVLCNGSISGKFVMDVRKRKGKKLEIPNFNQFYDKLS